MSRSKINKYCSVCDRRLSITDSDYTCNNCKKKIKKKVKIEPKKTNI